MMSAGLRAVQVWDSKVPHYFLRTFGRPARVTACSCERMLEPSVAQVLHLLNAPELQAKLAHDGGTAARLAATITDDGRLAEEIYAICFSRPPTVAERATAVAFLVKRGEQRRAAVEDLLWSLMNTLEFTFNH